MAPLQWNEDIARAYFRKYLRLQQAYDVELKRALAAAGKESARLLSTLPSGTFAERTRIAQYATQRSALFGVVSDLWGDIAGISRRGIADASKLGAKAAFELASYLSGSGSGALFDGFRAAAQTAVTNVQSRFINSIDLSPRVYKNVALAQGQVDRVVNNGILLGKSAREIAADVRRLISARAPGGVSFSAMRLGRTELNNAFHTTQTRAYAEQPWVTGVVWKLSGSHPRPDACDQYAKDDHDGLGAGVFDRRNVPGKPHPQCLCFVVAATVSREEFISNLMAGKYRSVLYI